MRWSVYHCRQTCPFHSSSNHHNSAVPWDYSEAEDFFTDFMTKAKQVEQCLGVFSWEPQSYGGWKNYGKGMFDDSGKPTSAFNAFKR